MQKLFLLLFIACLFTVSVASGQVKVQLQVIEFQSKTPLQEVLVSAGNSELHGHTNGDGLCVLENVPVGLLQVEVSKQGYENVVLNLKLKSDTTVVLDLRSRTLSLQEVAIAADRPVSAASSLFINSSSFANRPRNSAQDLLKMVPGLFIAQHAGGGKAEQIFIRGFDCDHGTDVAVNVDGIPVNMPSHGHGQGYADLHFLIPEVVEGISVFKGASSPLYGDFATGGAVGFKTLDSIQTNVLQVDAGSVVQTSKVTNSRLLTIFKVPFATHKVQSYFAAEALQGPGYFEVNQDLRRFNLFSKTSVELSDVSKLQVLVSGFGSSWNASGQVPQRAVNSGLISRFGSIDPNEGGTTQRTNYSVNYSAKLGSREFLAQAYAIDYRFRLFSNFTFFLEDSLRGDMIEQDDSRKVSGLNLKYVSGHPFLDHLNTFTFGATYRADQIQNQLWYAPNRFRTQVKANAFINQRSGSLYGNEVVRFTDRFRTELGLRYDYFIFDVEDLRPTDSTHQNYSGYNYQSGLNPKLNFIYLLSDSWTLFANSGTGFHSNDARSVVQDPTNHKLPKAYSSEIGSLFKYKKTAVSLALWAMDLTNELVYVGDDGTTENKGASRRNGVDLSIRSQVLSWMFVDLDFNYAKPRFIDHAFGVVKKNQFYIPLAPVLTSVGGLTLRPSSVWEVSIRYRYMANRPAKEDNSIVALGYQVMDANVAYKKGHYKVGLSIENLFNADWNEAQFATETRLKSETIPVEELHFTPGTPFNVKLSVGYLF